MLNGRTLQVLPVSWALSHAMGDTSHLLDSVRVAYTAWLYNHEIVEVTTSKTFSDNDYSLSPGWLCQVSNRRI